MTVDVSILENHAAVVVNDILVGENLFSLLPRGTTGNLDQVATRAVPGRGIHQISPDNHRGWNDGDFIFGAAIVRPKQLS